MPNYSEFKVILLFSLLYLVGLSNGETNYKNHHLYKIKLDSKQHEQLILEIKKHSSIEHYDSLNNEVFLNVPPNKVSHINGLLRKNRIKRSVLDYDMQKRINEEAKYVKPANASADEFGWENYYHLETIYAWLDKLAEKYDDVITKVDAGLSYEGVPLKGVKLSYKSGNKVIFIESGIHARERIAPATATFILNQLLTSNDSQVRDIAENFDWIIFPSINPDGYKYTFKEDRLWRKTRSPHGNCFGVDLNRNWDFKWNTIDEDSDACGMNYPGPYPFSEKESRQLSNFLKTQQIQVYLSFHSAAQLILFPYAATNEKPPNFDDLNAIGRSAATAISKRYGTYYNYGNARDTIYPAAGTSMDYVYSQLRIPIVFTFELRRDHIQILPANEIIPTGLETLDAFVALLNEARARKYGSNVNLEIDSLHKDDDPASLTIPFEIYPINGDVRPNTAILHGISRTIIFICLGFVGTNVYINLYG